MLARRAAYRKGCSRNFTSLVPELELFGVDLAGPRRNRRNGIRPGGGGPPPRRAIVACTSFAGSFAIVKATLGRLPIWLRVEPAER